MSNTLQRFSARAKVRLFAAILFLCTVLLAGVWLWNMREGLTNDFKTKAQAVTAATTLNLGPAIWFYQKDFIAKIMKPLENDDDTDFLQIIDVGGKRVYGFRDAPAEGLIASFQRSTATSEVSENRFLLKQPVFYNEALQGYLICGFDMKRVEARFQFAINTVLISLGGLFLALIVLTSLFGNALTKPVLQAAELLNSENADSERFHLRFSEAQGAELATLGGAINRIGELYDEKLKTFRHYEDYIGAFFKLSPIPILITDPNGLIEKSNETASMFFEQPLSKIEESTLSDLIGANDFVVIQDVFNIPIIDIGEDVVLEGLLIENGGNLFVNIDTTL